LAPGRAPTFSPTALEAEAYGEAGIVSRSRIYERVGAERIMLLVSSSGGKRHTTHNPRYCMLVNGWNVQAEKKVFSERSESRFAMMKLPPERNGEFLEMRYWLDSNEGATALTSGELFVPRGCRATPGGTTPRLASLPRLRPPRIARHRRV
jgi:hypothetical protein